MPEIIGKIMKMHATVVSSVEYPPPMMCIQIILTLAIQH